MMETMMEVEIDAPDDDDVFNTYGAAAGALVTHALNAIDPWQREIVARALEGGTTLTLITDVEPLRVRGILRLPGGDIVNVFTVCDGKPAPLH